MSKSTVHKWRGHEIKPKLDFGTQAFLINGRWVKKGWVVVKDHCNVMPAACWFQTVSEARRAINVLIRVKGNADKFWEVMQPFEYTRVGQKADFQSGLVTQGRFKAVIENFHVVKLTTNEH